MSQPLFEKHRATLDGALNAIQTRSYWSAYSEMPSPKVYGETAPDDGKRAFEAHLGRRFELACKRLGLNKAKAKLSTDLFLKPGNGGVQLSLF